MGWKAARLSFVLALGMTAAFAAHSLAEPGEPTVGYDPTLGSETLNLTVPGDCYNFSNSRPYHNPVDSVAYCAGSGPGCTECVVFPGGATVGTCYPLDSNRTVCIYNQIAPWTSL